MKKIYNWLFASCLLLAGCKAEQEKDKNFNNQEQKNKALDAQDNKQQSKQENNQEDKALDKKVVNQIKQVSGDTTKTAGVRKMENDSITTPSGLSYRILRKAQEGAAQPKVGQLITAHYTGWLQEKGAKGKKFDSSFDRNEPIAFKVGVGYVIKGWDEALLDMKVGEKRELVIPANLAYGSRGAGAAIPPDATLIFEVELCSIKA